MVIAPLLSYTGYEDHILRWRDYQGNTMLHYAAMINHERFIFKVLETQDICEISNAVFQKNWTGCVPYYITGCRMIKNVLAWTEKQTDSYHLRTPPNVAIFYMEEDRP